MPNYLPSSIPENSRSMLFVDGENLAIRYKSLLASGTMVHQDHVIHLADVYVWSRYQVGANHKRCSLIRSHYYTCMRADDGKIEEVTDILMNAGISDPRVFKKKSNGRSKRVDITLATEMLSHAHYDNYDVAILVAGDEDYVPLVQEVKRMGKQVALWFFPSGLSKHLRRECDVFFDISFLLNNPQSTLACFV